MENKRELFQILTRRFGLLNKNCCQTTDAEVSTIQSHILYEIHRQPHATMQQVADVLGMDVTTFSRQIQTLVKLELVKKVPSETDRRYYHLSLTDKGIRVQHEIDEQMTTYLEEVFAHFSESEKQQILASIQLLNRAMSQSSVCCTPVL